MSVEAAAGRGTAPGSMMTTRHPRRDNSQAAVRPKTPAPTITIERVPLMLGHRSYERSGHTSGRPNADWARRFANESRKAVAARFRVIPMFQLSIDDTLRNNPG